MVLLKILGSAQDGGIPHFGCTCAACVTEVRKIASLAVLGETMTIIDATPDFSSQVRMLGNGSSGINRIFLTHLHIGHYIGLLQLGKEVASLEQFPVHMSTAVLDFIKTNKPFSYLVTRGNIDPKVFTSSLIPIDVSVSILPVPVPHRNEDGDTHGFVINNIENDRSCLYIPDIDYFDEDIIKKIGEVDIAILDGTFYSHSEIPRQDLVPHPPIEDSIERLQSHLEDTRILFTHFNHTNLLFRDEDKRRRFTDIGFEMAVDGLEIKL